jgi:hypothetical protein
MLNQFIQNQSPRPDRGEKTISRRIIVWLSDDGGFDGVAVEYRGEGVDLGLADHTVHVQPAALIASGHTDRPDQGLAIGHFSAPGHQTRHQSIALALHLAPLRQHFPIAVLIWINEIA